MQQHNTAEPNITIVVLAGGRGRRMGEQDKGLIALSGKSLIEHVINAISAQNNKIIINSNQNLARYEAYGYPVVTDELADFQGPLAGMACSMKVASTPYILTVPCDAPFISEDYQSLMWSALQVQQTDIVVAHDGQRLQSIHALVPVNLLGDLELFLTGNERSLVAWYSHFALGLADFSKQKEIFNNFNTYDDLKAFDSEIRR